MTSSSSHQLSECVPIILCRLQDVAAAGQQGGWSEQKLQRCLLDQLQPEVACMQPDELLAEFKALQMMVMYDGADGGEVQQQGAGKGKKGVDANTEVFGAAGGTNML